MLFQDEHIDQIRGGEKTATRRDWADNYARPSEGSIRMASTEMFQSDESCDCYIRVTDVYQEELGEMTEQDAEKEGSYSLEEFREVWREINGEWDPSLVVDVVEFEYVGLVRPSEGREVLPDGGTPADGDGHWTFSCNQCDFVSQEDSEPDALTAVDKHEDYGPGHFDFKITDPDGVEQYP